MKQFLCILLASLLWLSGCALAADNDTPLGQKQSGLSGASSEERRQSIQDFLGKSDDSARKAHENSLKAARRNAEAALSALEQADEQALDSWYKATVLSEIAITDLLRDGMLPYALLAEAAGLLAMEYEGDPYEQAASPDQTSPWNFEWMLPGGVYVEFMVKNEENDDGEPELFVWKMDVAMDGAGDDGERVRVAAYRYEELITAAQLFSAFAP